MGPIRTATLSGVLQGLVVWSVVVVAGEWTVTIPRQVSAPIGSCMVIPCSFTRPTPNKLVTVKWYQYVSWGYPLVYSASDPDSVIKTFRGKTELIGSTSEGDCSLKIHPTQAAQNNEKIFVWIEPNQLSGYFYDKTVTLQVTDTVPQPEIRAFRGGRDLGTPPSVQLTEGDRVKLSCDVFHTCPSSPPSVSFQNDVGAVLSRNTDARAGRWLISMGMSWTVRSVDNGRSILCDVTYPGGQVASKWIELDVNYPPKSVRIHGDQTVVIRASLSCRSQANPAANSFQWYRVVGGQLRRLVHSSETAVITELDRDQNLFRCTAQNSVGSGSSSDFQVIREYKPSISEASQCNFYSGSLSCWCKATARPPATLQWRVGGVTSPAQSSSTNGNAVNGTWAGTGVKKTASVTCVFKNRHGQVERLLQVRAPPTNVAVTQTPPRPREGQGATLTCSGRGTPPVSGYRWYRWQEGRETELEGGSRELRVALVTRNSGPYQCMARNEVGETSSSVTQLNVEYAPEILPDSSCILGNGQVRCECVVDSSPTAKVTWSSSGSTTNEKLNTSSILSGRLLRSILTGPMGDEGHHFYCNATNRLGGTFYRLQMPSTVGLLPIVSGATGGALVLCLLLGAIFFCKRKKRPHKHPDLSLKEVRHIDQGDVGDVGDVGANSLYENTAVLHPSHQASETVYELAVQPQYGQVKRPPYWTENVYQNY